MREVTSSTASSPEREVGLAQKSFVSFDNSDVKLTAARASWSVCGRRARIQEKGGIDAFANRIACSHSHRRNVAGSLRDGAIGVLLSLVRDLWEGTIDLLLLLQLGAVHGDDFRNRRNLLRKPIFSTSGSGRRAPAARCGKPAPRPAVLNIRSSVRPETARQFRPH